MLDRKGDTRKQIRVDTHVPKRTQQRMINEDRRRPSRGRNRAPKKIDKDILGKMIKSLEG